jgi:hypothetical protein
MKGNPAQLAGRIIAYAKILPEAEGTERQTTPFDDMVSHGLLAVFGDFRRSQNIGDFIRNNMSDEMRENFEDFLQNMDSDDLPEGVDADSLREKMEEVSRMEIIPIPAKIVKFESEAIILSQNADIYYLGEFVGLSQAHLCITSFPIFYQAKYREQSNRLLRTEIDALLSDVERRTDALPSPENDNAVLRLEGNLNTYPGRLIDLLEKTAVPNLVYNLQNAAEFKASWDNFKRFMAPYKYPSDIDALERQLHSMKDAPGPNDRRKLELLCKKISALYHEQYEDLGAIQAELAVL